MTAWTAYMTTADGAEHRPRAVHGDPHPPRIVETAIAPRLRYIDWEPSPTDAALGIIRRRYELVKRDPISFLAWYEEVVQ